MHYVKNVRIQSKCGKIRTRKTPNTDTFHVVRLCKTYHDPKFMKTESSIQQNSILEKIQIRENPYFDIFEALRDMVTFVQFKKREKHPWRSVNFSKVAG